MQWITGRSTRTRCGKGPHGAAEYPAPCGPLLQRAGHLYVRPQVQHPQPRRTSSMLHHISLGALDIERAARFYDAVLEPLGFMRVWSDLRPGEDEQAVGYGPPGSDDLLAVKQVEQPIPNIPGFHIALAAPSRASVAAFHAAALANGGSDNGPPGLRPDYGPNYFAAFVVDPEGHRLEAVCKAPD